jgi:hypothetical protein
VLLENVLKKLEKENKKQKGKLPFLYHPKLLLFISVLKIIIVELGKNMRNPINKNELVDWVHYFLGASVQLNF